MTVILLTIQFVVTIAMIGTILLQRSEGGALGLGGGGGVSSLMSGRGAANALSRSTVILAAIFIATSLALAMIAKANSHSGSVILPNSGQPGGPTVPGRIPVLPGAPTPTPTPSGAAPSAPGSPAAPSPLVPAVPVPAGPAAPAPSGPAAPASGGGH